MNTVLTNPIRENKLTIDIYLCKHCNLKCRGCSRYCNIAENGFYDFETLKKDILTLKQTNIDFDAISFSGGEPLLYPQLLEILEYTRTIFKDIHISIVTNGLLFNYKDCNFYETLSKLNIEVYYTLYPYSKINYYTLVKICKEYNIVYNNINTDEYNSHGNVNDFEIQCSFWTNRLSYIVNPSTYKRKICNNDCLNLWDSKIYKCVTIPFIDTLNKKYNENFTIEKADYLELSKDLTFEQIVDFWKSECPFCKYCFNVDNIKFKWERANPNKSDWIK